MSTSLSVCKCAYMRGLAIWAPTQTISLFWKCSLKSSEADGSQEQRGKWALASFRLSLQAFPLQSLCQLASKAVPEACRKLKKPERTRFGHERSHNGSRVAADSQAKLSVIRLSSSAFLLVSHTYVVSRRHAPNQPSVQVVSVGSQGCAEQHRTL